MFVIPDRKHSSKPYDLPLCTDIKDFVELTPRTCHWKADSRSLSRTSLNSWNPKAHCRVNKSRRPYTVLRNMPDGCSNMPQRHAGRPPCHISASACSRPQLSFISGSCLGIHNDAAGHEIPNDDKSFPEQWSALQLGNCGAFHNRNF
jgi:hypothetical protein